MADDKHFVMGDFYRIDDRTGFKVRARKTRQEWTGLIVDRARWEPRQPQDFVKGVTDNQNVPLPRPRSVDAYDGPLHTFITIAANIGDTLITVNSSARMYAGDEIDLVLDNGVVLRSLVVQVPSSTQLRLEQQLPWTASINNDLTNLSAVSPSNQGINGFGQPE